jgi:hypothetical protein
MSCSSVVGLLDVIHIPVLRELSRAVGQRVAGLESGEAVRTSWLSRPPLQYFPHSVDLPYKQEKITTTMMNSITVFIKFHN